MTVAVGIAPLAIGAIIGTSNTQSKLPSILFAVGLTLILVRLLS